MFAQEPPPDFDVPGRREPSERPERSYHPLSLFTGKNEMDQHAAQIGGSVRLSAREG